MVSRRLAFAACLSALTGCGYFRNDPSIVITGATLIDGTGHPPVDDAIVVVQRDKITAMGPRNAIEAPANAVRFEAKGRFIFPADINDPLKVGGFASLLILTTNPALDSEYERHAAGRMIEGRWTQYPQ